MYHNFFLLSTIQNQCEAMNYLSKGLLNQANILYHLLKTDLFSPLHVE